MKTSGYREQRRFCGVDPLEWARLAATSPSVPAAYAELKARMEALGFPPASFVFDCDSRWTTTAQELHRHEAARLQVAFVHFCEGLRVRHLAERCPREVLSSRERECLCWVAAGHSTKEIAELLSLADATVDEYIAAAMRKLEASNRTQACARAALLSLIQP